MPIPAEVERICLGMEPKGTGSGTVVHKSGKMTNYQYGTLSHDTGFKTLIRSQDMVLHN